MDGDRLLVLAAVLAARLAPRSLLADAAICPFRRITGRPCPACGLTRSWSAAMRLDVRESAAWHPLGIPVLLGALAVSAGFWHQALEGPVARRWAVAAGAVWLGTWAVRFARPPARLRRTS